MYHWWNALSHPNQLLKQTLLQLKQSNQRPVITRVCETMDEEEAYEIERTLISQHGRVDLGTGTLCNKTPGGEGFGNTGTHWTTTQRQKREQAYIKRAPGVAFDQYDLNGNKLKSFGNARSLNAAGYSRTQIMAIRKCCKGERFSVGGFRWSYGNNPLPASSTSMKRVLQLDKMLQPIRTYISVAEASNITGINAGDIASVARGNTRMKSAGGFVWRYTD